MPGAIPCGGLPEGNVNPPRSWARPWPFGVPEVSCGYFTLEVHGEFAQLGCFDRKNRMICLPMAYAKAAES